MRIVLAAEEAAGVHALRLVTGSGHDLHAVLTSSRADDQTRGVTVASVAREHGVPIVAADRVTDPAFAAELSQAGVDVLLNVHSLHLIDASVLAAPRFGCFNLHPGPLPQYAGVNVPSWALYHGERSHGVTLHWMTPQVDAGPVAYRTSFDVTPKDTGLSVSATCARLGLTLVAQLLDDLSRDPAGIPASAQDPQARRYFGRRVPHDGWVPWDAAAQQIVDFVRACDYGPWESPWGRPRTRGGRRVVTVGRARRTGRLAEATPGTVGGCDDGETLVAAGDEWVGLRNLRVEGAAVTLAEGEVLQPSAPLAP